MAGTSTIPAFSGTATARLISLRMIDASGDNHSEALYIAPTATDAEVQALIDQYQAATQSSLFSITDTYVYEGDEDSDNAETDQRNSVKQGINLLYKDPASPEMSITPRVVAPVPAILQGNQDIPLLTAAPFPALIAAITALKPTYNLTSAQYTERRERSNNPRVKV